MSDLLNRFIVETGQAGEIAMIVEPILEELDYRLVRVQLSGSQPATLQIMAEKEDGSLTVEDCARISRELSPLLDSYDMIKGKYYLEVSSPGLGRPLVRGQDFEFWRGYEAKITLREAVDGQKRFRGEIDGFVDEEVRIKMNASRAAREDTGDDVVLGFPAHLIEKATLLINDDILKMAGQETKSQHKKDKAKAKRDKKRKKISRPEDSQDQQENN